MRRTITLGLASSLLAAVVVAAPAPAKKRQALVGAWIHSSDMGGDMTITFTADGKLKFDDGRSAVEEGAYKVNDKKGLPEIDFVTPARANPANGKPPLLGIYRIEGDSLTLYLAERNRPVKFEAPDGSGVMRLTLKRAKKK